MEILEEIKADDGNKIGLRLWLPHGPVKYAVVGFHGMVSHSAWFAKFGKAITERGGMLIVADRRGSGLSFQSPLVKDSELALRDQRQVLQLAQKYSSRICLFLWCGGAVYGLPLASDACIERIFFAAPAVALQDAIVRKMATDVAKDDYFPIPFDPVLDFSENSDIQKFIEEDKFCLRRQAVASRLVDQQVIEKAKLAFGGISKPMLCLLSRGDKIVDNEKCKKLFKPEVIKEIQGGHAIILEQPELVADMLHQFNNPVRAVA